MIDNFETFSFGEVYPGFTCTYDSSITLPPDFATVNMARRAGQIVRRSVTARFLYDGIVDTGIHAVDLGAGAGVIGVTLMAGLPNLERLTAIDIDEATLPFARANYQNANEHRSILGKNLVVCDAKHNSWHDESFWAELGPTELIISNPPYLLSGESIRSGYENTPASHLFVADRDELNDNYAAILVNALNRMRNWDSVFVRLPWSGDLSERNWLADITAQALDASDVGVSDNSCYVAETHRLHLPLHPDKRPLHAASIVKLPLDYPAISPSGDARVDYYLRHGEDNLRLPEITPRSPGDLDIIVRAAPIV